ncbi:MAG TPA: hypothetical protein VF341_04755, partial [Anaeromyxobacteraceae bacterium]
LAREGKSIDEIGLALRANDFHLYQRLYALQRRGAVSATAAPTAPPAASASRESADEARAATAQLRADLLDPPRTPRLKVRSHEVALMRLSAAEKYLLGRCDGTRDLRQIVQLAPLSELEVLRSVKKFVEGRIVELG